MTELERLLSQSLSNLSEELAQRLITTELRLSALARQVDALTNQVNALNDQLKN